VYVPQSFAMDDDAVQGLLREHGAGDLVTATARGLVATMLPFIHDPDRGPHGALLGHVARNNDHWRHASVGEALVILRGPDAYISPQWYASKREHGRVVPTWNYSAVHLTGRVTVRDDEAWVRDIVERLTDRHEEHRANRWSVEDAPDGYIDKQLRAIVGIELLVERVEAKAKLSQNRSDEDRTGVVEGLEETGVVRDALVAGDMRRAGAT
jgi:transcriptional regulator